MEEQTDVEIMVERGMTVIVFKATSISNVQKIKVISGQIRDFIEANSPKGVVFDFEEVKFFSSQVLGLLLDIRDRLKSCNGEVVISAIEPKLHRVFTITNLDKIFRFFPDRESAVSALNVGID